MPYIGNTVQTQGFTPAIDYFSGNGVTVTFTLTRPVSSVAQMIVAIDNVIQNPSSAFTVAGSAITFTSAPLSGTNNIWVEYTSLITTYAAISQDPTVIGDITTNGGGFLSTGDFGNAYLAGTIVDYVTGLGRVTVGPSEGVTLYNGGTSGRNALLTANSTGVGIGTTSPASKLNLQSTGGGNYVAFSTAGTNKAFVGIDNGGEIVSGAVAGDAIFRTQQQMWFGLNGGGVAGRFDSSGVFYMNSGYGSAAAAYAVRTYINFNGNTSTINQSKNVTSISRNGSSDYSIFFTNNFPDANYAWSAAGTNVNNSTGTNYSGFFTTTGNQQVGVLRIFALNIYNGGANFSGDPYIVSVMIVR
jgi:hypothetical protein